MGRPERRRRTHRRPRGFTLVEVMMSIAVMTVGAVAIFSMQNITATGSRRSRQIMTATEINRQWIERVKLAATGWTDQQPNTTIAWLDQLPATGTGSSGWFLPAVTGAGNTLVTPASSWEGRPTGVPSAGGPAAPYCTSLRMTWLSSTVDQVARVDVRTWWHRGTRAATTVDECGVDQATLTATLNDILSFGSVHGSTVVRWQGVQE